jgi:hypothetical protein
MRVARWEACMVLKALMWTAAVLVYLGARAPEGNLFYFFAVLLATAAIGRLCRRRAVKAAGAVPAPAEARAKRK